MDFSQCLLNFCFEAPYSLNSFDLGGYLYGCQHLLPCRLPDFVCKVKVRIGFRDSQLGLTRLFNKLILEIEQGRQGFMTEKDSVQYFLF